MNLLFVAILILLLLSIFSYLMIIKNLKLKYSLFLLSYPFIEILLILNEYLFFKYPVFMAKNVTGPIIISFLPFIISIIFILIKKNKTIFKFIYGLFLCAASLYCLLFFWLSCVFSGLYFYSGTTDVSNYLKFDEKVKNLFPYDISYFPQSLDNLNVIEYKYEFTKFIDARYDVLLIVQYSLEDYNKEYERIKSLNGFINTKDSTTKFIKNDNYCNYDCFLNYIGFDDEKNTVIYAMTHREGNTHGIPYYFK